MGLEYWFLFPTGILVATLGMSSGISGSNFWIVIYLVWMRLEPRVAFWVSLATMLFGFGSGVVRNLRDATFDRRLISLYIRSAIPGALLGAVLSQFLPIPLLLLAFAVFVIGLGLWILGSELHAESLADDPMAERPEGAPRHGESPNTDTHTQEPAAHGRGFLAGFLQGAIATGSGVVLLPCLMGHRRISEPATAVGSTVILVFVLSLISILFRLDAALWETLTGNAADIASMLAFACPGVVVGGQLGPRLAQRLPRNVLRRYVSILLLAVGGLVLLRVASF